MGRTNFRSYNLYFEDKAVMNRFILMYRDMFHSWSEDEIASKCKVYDDDRHFHFENGRPRYRIVPWHLEPNKEAMMREGYLIHDNEIYVHMKPDDFREMIKGNFKKEKDTRRSNLSIYRYVPEKIKS